MRGRSFQVGRTGVSERTSTSGNECANRACQVTAADCRGWKREKKKTYLIEFVTQIDWVNVIYSISPYSIQFEEKRRGRRESE